MAAQGPSIQQVITSHELRLKRMESEMKKKESDVESFDMDSFKEYVDKMDEMGNYLKKENWELGHELNKREKEINDLTKLVLSLSATVETLKEHGNNTCGDMEKQD
jgi:predicted RNase H-like nuclease (RuvC/YqgF family)